MNQVICLVGVGNWTVHKVENLPSFSESRSEERKGGGEERGREKDIFIKTTEYIICMPCHGLVAKRFIKLHTSEYSRVKKKRKE